MIMFYKYMKQPRRNSKTFMRPIAKSTCPKILYKNVVRKNFVKCVGKHYCWSYSLRFQHRCFTVNFAKLFKTAFCIEHLRLFYKPSFCDQACITSGRISSFVASEILFFIKTRWWSCIESSLLPFLIKSW